MENNLIKQFYDHPDWRHVEDVIMTYADELVKMDNIDLTQPADEVKVEVIGRLRAHEMFCKFLSDSKIVGRELSKPKNPFK